jgi:glutathione S-transferase
VSASPERVRVIGSYLSPYVRKVLFFLHAKGVPYEIDPIVPFLGDERFSRLSPLRRIPVLCDGGLTLSDSSVICQYLEERWPEPALFPSDVAQRARARWLEEYADTRMGEVLIWGLFNQVAINPFVFGKPTDPEALRRTIEEDVPHVLDYLEGELPAEGFLFGPAGIADVSIASFFRNAAFARYRVDPARWPRTAAFVERALRLEGFARLVAFEERTMRTPPARHREVLAALGAPLTADTYATDVPRPGSLRI